MRLSKWVRVFDNVVPIPMTFATAFGIRENSMIYMAPILDAARGGRRRVELIISPILATSWSSVCRLSVRIADEPGSLAIAADFLRRKRVSVLMSETTSTLANRAHWDAICDLRHHPDFVPSAAGADPDRVEHSMDRTLAALASAYRDYADEPKHSKAFIDGSARYIKFASLTGLNQAAYRCVMAMSKMEKFRQGAITLSEAYLNQIKNALGQGAGDSSPIIPRYALITGNTEQKYLRVLFVEDISNIFSARIEVDMSGMNPAGRGAIPQLLDALPKGINLLRLATFSQGHSQDDYRMTLELLGHWPRHSDRELRRALDSAVLVDSERASFANRVRIAEYGSPRHTRPGIYVSHHSACANALLKLLRSQLEENGFEMVTGTSASHADVSAASLTPISECVAFISLQTRSGATRTEAGQTAPSNWLVAEEAYAFARTDQNIGSMHRLVESGVECADFGNNIMRLGFSDQSRYRTQLVTLMRRLNEFRASEKFVVCQENARKAMFKPRIPPYPLPSRSGATG